MALADEFEELESRHQRDFLWGKQKAVCRRCQEDTAGPSRKSNNKREPDPVRHGFVVARTTGLRSAGTGRSIFDGPTKESVQCGVLGVTRVAPKTLE